MTRVYVQWTISRSGYNVSNARKLQFCKQPFEIIQGQIAFKNTVQCVNKQTVVLLLHPVFQRARRVYFGASPFLERGISFRANSITGYQFSGKFFLERGAIWSLERHIPTQKNTQVPPREARGTTNFGREANEKEPSRESLLKRT